MSTTTTACVVGHNDRHALVVFAGADRARELFGAGPGLRRKEVVRVRIERTRTGEISQVVYAGRL